jgi:hypothetical protein
MKEIFNKNKDKNEMNLKILFFEELIDLKENENNIKRINLEYNISTL